MGRSPLDVGRRRPRRTLPVMEGLESRLVMSVDAFGAPGMGAGVDPLTVAGIDPPAPAAARTAVPYSASAMTRAVAAAPGSPAELQAVPAQAGPSPVQPTPVLRQGGGTFRKNYQQFTYRTPGGGVATLSIQGRGSLQGTYVDSSGALNLRFGLSNAYTKIVSNVQGGDGRAPLASVFSQTMASSGTQGDLSGIGSPVIGMVNLRQYDLIPGGTINLEAGVGVLGLQSAAAGSQIQLRELTGMEPASDRYDARGNTPTYNASLANVINVNPPGSTSQSGLTGTVQTGANPIISNLFLVQTLAGGDGEIISAGNVLLQTTHGDPGLPPPPPGVVVAIDRVDGALTAPVNLQTDPRIFGYDPATGQVLRFQLNLNDGTGAVDGSFAPIVVPGAPADVGLSLGRDAGRLALLVNTGSTITAYDATYGADLGSFTVPAGFFATGSTDVFTVIGGPSANQLQQIDVTASLAAGHAVAPAGNPAPYAPPAGLSLLGGLTGIPASVNVYTSVAGTYNTLQPLENQLGFLNVSVTATKPSANGGQNVVNSFATVQQQASTPFVPIPAGNPDDVATSMGSVDRSLAVNTGLANGAAAANTIRLQSQVTATPRGTITLNYPDQLSALSESFRPDLAASVIIDVQGTIQSVHGTSANGLVLNDSGFLNLVSFQKMSNSTIIGEPVNHVRIVHRDNVFIGSTERTAASRGAVTLIPNLQQVGPLSQTRNRPQP